MSLMPSTFAISAEVRSLSITASTPRRIPLGARMTGMPPPPAAMTTEPLCVTASISEMSTM